MRQLILILFILSHSVSIAYGQEKLIFALDLIRHGDRTPLDEIPSITYTWPEGKGQLTQKGIEQEYRLGVKFRQKYVEQTGLLPKDYNNQMIYIRSTDTDRTLMSAQSLMLGLYPGTKIFPIHTQPLTHDPLIPYDLFTSKFTLAKEQFVYSRPDWQEKQREIQPKFEKWSHALGQNIQSLEDIKKIADILYIHRLHDKPLPPLDFAEIEEIIQAGKWAFVTSYQPRAIGLFTSEIYQEITQYLEAASKSSTLKYVLFSAHDSTILALMSLLEVPLNDAPPYAAYLNFALYENGNQHYIKVTYNDAPVRLPHCNVEGCTLEQWQQLV